jgi:hypothetical protein
VFKKQTAGGAELLYYKTGTSNKVADLRFDEKKSDGGIGKIKALLDKGTTSTPLSHKLPLRAYGARRPPAAQ